MNIIDMLKADHRKVETLFENYVDNHDLATTIVEELVKHMHLEETLVYPVVATSLEDGEELARHSTEEHLTVKQMFETFLSDPDNVVIAEQIRSEVEHHVQEEETELFPKLTKALGKKKLTAMGKEAEAFKNG